MCEKLNKLTVKDILTSSGSQTPFSPAETHVLFTAATTSHREQTLSRLADSYIDRFYGREMDLPGFQEAGIEDRPNLYSKWMEKRMDPRLIELWRRMNYAEYILQKVQSNTGPLLPYSDLNSVWITLPQNTLKVSRMKTKSGETAEIITEPFIARTSELSITQLDEDMRPDFFRYHRNPDGTFHNFYNNRKSKAYLPLNGILIFKGR